MWTRGAHDGVGDDGTPNSRWTRQLPDGAASVSARLHSHAFTRSLARKSSSESLSASIEHERSHGAAHLRSRAPDGRPTDLSHSAMQQVAAASEMFAPHTAAPATSASAHKSAMVSGTVLHTSATVVAIALAFASALVRATAVSATGWKTTRVAVARTSIAVVRLALDSIITLAALAVIAAHSLNRDSVDTEDVARGISLRIEYDTELDARDVIPILDLPRTPSRVISAGASANEWSSVPMLGDVGNCDLDDSDDIPVLADDGEHTNPLALPILEDTSALARRAVPHSARPPLHGRVASLQTPQDQSSR